MNLYILKLSRKDNYVQHASKMSNLKVTTDIDDARIYRSKSAAKQSKELFKKYHPKAELHVTNVSLYVR